MTMVLPLILGGIALGAYALEKNASGGPAWKPIKNDSPVALGQGQRVVLWLQNTTDGTSVHVLSTVAGINSQTSVTLNLGDSVDNDGRPTPAPYGFALGTFLDVDPSFLWPPPV